MTVLDDQSQGAGAPAQNADTNSPEPGGSTGGEGGTPTAPVQARTPRAGNKPPERGMDDIPDEVADRLYAKGFKAGRREALTSLEQEHGAPVKDILTEWKSLKESHAKGERTESAEMTKLQRQLAQAQETIKAKETALTTLASEVAGYKITQPIAAAVTRVQPKNERYASILTAEMQRRVKLDDDGELTVLSIEGKPQHKSTLDDLAKEIAESMPDLVAPPRAGVGVSPSAPPVQPRAGAKPQSNGRGVVPLDEAAARIAQFLGR